MYILVFRYSLRQLLSRTKRDPYVIGADYVSGQKSLLVQHQKNFYTKRKYKGKRKRGESRIKNNQKEKKKACVCEKSMCIILYFSNTLITPPPRPKERVGFILEITSVISKCASLNFSSHFCVCANLILVVNFLRSKIIFCITKRIKHN